MRKWSIAVFLLVAFVRPPVLFMQTADVLTDVFADAPIITHVGIVVPNLIAAVDRYTRVFGVGTRVGRGSIPLPDGTRADINYAFLWLPNFRLEIMEPLSKYGPYYEHLQKYGIGIQHLGIVPRGDVAARTEAMVKNGGRCVGGPNFRGPAGAEPAGDGCYYWDFGERLGFALEIQGQERAFDEMNRGMLLVSSNRQVLAGSAVTHVGIVVRDLDRSMKTFADLLGLAPQPARRVPPAPALFPFPPGHQWNANAHVMSTMLIGRGYRDATMGVELIQSMGEPTPWSQTLCQQRRDAIQHLGFSHGLMTRDEWLRVGQANGGKWVVGGPAPNGTFAYLDFSDTLGFMLEW